MFALSINSVLAGDSTVLVKVKYYGTHVTTNFSPLTIPNRYNMGDILDKLRYDSIVNIDDLHKIDSLTRNSKTFFKAYLDTTHPYYFDNIEVKRVIVFIYNNKKIYLSDNGNWAYDFRLLTNFFYLTKKSRNTIKRRTIKNKFIYLNGPKFKNDRHLRKAIKQIQVYLNCGWCESQTNRRFLNIDLYT